MMMNNHRVRFKHKIMLGSLITALSLSITYAKEVTLKVTHFLPALAPAQTQVLEPWCAAIKKDSNNQFNCQFYPAMQLGGTPAQLIQQVRNGVADIVWTAPGYSAGVFPIIEAMELPFMVRDSVSSSSALWQFYEKYARDEFKNYKVLAMFTDGGMTVHTNKKKVDTAPAFTGLKLRASTKYVSKTIAILGANPIAMPPSQLTESISKGVIDGALGSWELLAPTKLNEITKFHTEMPRGKENIGATVLMVLMNKEKYARLSPELKSVIDRHSGAILSKQFSDVFDQKIKEGRTFAEKKGDEIVHLSDDDYALLVKKASPVIQEWIDAMAQKKYDGKQMIEDLKILSK